MARKTARPVRRLLLKGLRARRTAGATVSGMLGHVRRAELAFMITAAIVIGLVGGGIAVGFRHLIQLSHGLFFQTMEVGLDTYAAMPWWQRLLVPAVGGLLVGPLVHFVARETRGSGVPEVMEAASLKGGFIRARVIVAKAVAAALTIGSGGSVGREGPIIQIGASVGSLVGQFLAVNPTRVRTFVACGAAAGIAGTFNAPIAGALFAVEVILGEMAVTSFSPIVISSVTATVLSRAVLGDHPAFPIPEYELLSATEFLPYTLLGVAAGLVSALFIRMVYGTQELTGRLPGPPWLKPAYGGLVVGAIAIGWPQVYGVGYETLHGALLGQTALLMLLVLIPIKMIATSATLGSGGSGGIFAPSLFVGAMLGGAVGTVAGMGMEGVATPGAYALVGMGAVVAGTTHGPISAILIIFELTGDYLIIPPLMVACILAVLLSSWLQPNSMYTEKLARRGLDLHARKEVNMLRRLAVRDVLDPSPARLSGSLTMRAVVDRMLHSAREDFFVVDGHDRLIGSFSLFDLRELLTEPDLPALVVAADVASSDAPTVRPGDNLDLVMHLFGQHDVEEIAVIDDDRERRLLGSVRRKHVIEAYNRKVFQHDLPGGFHSVATAAEHDFGVELLAGYRLVEVGVPYAFVGKTLQQVQVRKRYDVEVILIRKPVDGDGDIPSRPGAFPRPDYRLEAGDSLLVMGSREDIRRFRDALPPGRT